MEMRRPIVGGWFALAAAVMLPGAAASQAGDWSRFRGPNGLGASPDQAPTPVEWSETRNLKWKVALPGPGLSSPIIVGERIFVTSWSGYGADPKQPGSEKDLKRHLLCLDRRTGKTLWSKAVDPVLPEEPFRGMFAENGYASHTPASDGERVFVFFGKTGVLAFDMEGRQLWQTSVGDGDDRRGWGSASSPMLYKNLVIVPATVESHSLVALDKQTGGVVWRKEAEGFGSTWGTPVLADLPDGRQELVLSVPFEIWGFNPDTGKLLWYCESNEADSACSSAISHNGIVYSIEGRNGGSIAIRAGGEGNVTKTHVLWSGRDRGRIGTPAYHDGRLYSIGGGIANCLDAATGKQIYQARIKRSGDAGADEPPPGGGRRGFGGFGGMMGGQDYSSPVIADGKLYYVMRSGETVVLKLSDHFEQLAVNRFASDVGNYSATPERLSVLRQRETATTLNPLAGRHAPAASPPFLRRGRSERFSEIE
jgi:hypothetical protein